MKDRIKKKPDGLTVEHSYFQMFFLAVVLMLFMFPTVRAQAEEQATVVIDETQPHVGDTMNAVVTAESSANLSYQWYRDDTEIGTDATYTLSADDYEHWIKVEVSDASGNALLCSDQIYFSKLPVVYLTTDDGAEVASEYIDASLFIQGNSGYEAQYDGDTEVKVQDNSGVSYPQKSYNLELDDSTDLFGFGESSYWVLLSSYVDRCGMRNKLGSEIADVLGVSRMDMTWVDVVVNGSYAGMYMLCEQIRIEENRVAEFSWEDEAETIAANVCTNNTSTLTEDDKDAITKKLSKDLSWITSGTFKYGKRTYNISDYYTTGDDLKGIYLFELSATTDGLKAVVNSPESLNANSTLMGNVKNYWSNFEEALASSDGYNTDETHYSEIADVDSMVSYWLTMEIMGNDDTYNKSIYAYKDVDGKLQFGPVWDFDWGCGSYTVSTAATGWKSSTGSLWKDVVDDPYFQGKAMEKYWEIRDKLKSYIEDGGAIDTWKAELSEAGAASDAVYKDTTYSNYKRRTFADDATKFKTYLTTRLAWLDQQFASEETLTESLYNTESTAPYTKSDKLNITLNNATEDTDSDYPADGVIDYVTDLSITVAAEAGSETTKIAVYVNGVTFALSNGSSLADGKCSFEIPAESLNVTARNVISVVGYKADGSVSDTNYVTVTRKPKEVCVAAVSNPSNSGILSGGGTYKVGETITLKATAVSGYTFVGWYQGDEASTTDPISADPISTDPVCSVVVTDDFNTSVTYTAKFTANENKKLSVNVGSGTVTYSYPDDAPNGKSAGTWSNNLVNHAYPKGTYFKIKAVPDSENYTFLCWTNSENRVVSEKPEYSFYLGEDTSLTAWYIKTTDNACYVVFKDLNSKILWSGEVALDNGQGEVAVPEHGTFTGYNFSGWKDKDASGDSLLTVSDGKISISGNMTIYAAYEPQSGFAVTVNGSQESKTYSYGDLVTVTADGQDSNGKYFSGWYEGNQLVSNKCEYSFYITQDISLTAKYEGDEEILNDDPIIILKRSDGNSLADGKQTIPMVLSWSLPEGYTLVGAGIIMTPSDELGTAASLTLEKVDDSSVRKSATTLTTAEGTYDYTLTLSSAKTVYARGYLTYQDSTGAITTIYTTVGTTNGTFTGTSVAGN